METNAAAAVIQGSTKKYDIPLSHLDFDYINKCSNVKELEKILRILRSREEGFYPQLETCCEERIKNFNPNSRVLRKDNPIYTKTDLNLKEREELEQDLKTWSSDIRNAESTMGTVENDVAGEDDSDLPPIRSGKITLTAEGAKSSKPVTKTNKRVMPREYRDWDKIDVEKELEKVDDEGKQGTERTLIANKDVQNLPDHIDTKGLSEGEKLLKANREKDKGNEAFRSNDFKEAITYYSRSISLLPTAASYNNRALAYLKTSEWQKAISDTNTVLKLEPDNVKALLRRGTAYKGLKKLEKAREDLDNVLKMEPNNKRAQELLEQIDKEKQEKKKKGTRMVIEDVDGEEEAEKRDNSNATSSGDHVKGGNSRVPSSTTNSGDKPEQKTSRRMKIEEVDSDSDNEEEVISIGSKLTVNNEQDGKDVLMNGHATPDEQHKNSTCSEVESNGLNNTTDCHKQIWDESELENDSNNMQHKDSTKCEDSPIRVANNSESLHTSSIEEKADVENVNEEDNSDHVDKEEDRDADSESSSETDFVEASEQLQRPVFYMKELPATTVKIKDDATTLFKSGQYGEACLKYSKVIEILEKAEDQIVNLSLMYSNRAACHVKTGDLPQAVKDCNSSLQLIPNQVKSLLRRAVAYEHLERYSLAYIDYRHVLLLDSKVDQAHLGTKRCQHMLSEKDGPRWREKIHLQRVSPWQIPDIIGLDGKSTQPIVTHHLPAASQSQCVPVTNQSEPSITTPKPSPAQKVVPKEKEVPKQQQAKLSPQEQFEAFKAEGNEFVKQNKFREAIESYNQCEEVLPGQVAIYTNRALCFIRTNQAEKAAEDCKKALDLEKDNVKALFRRAQARKMLKCFREGIEDLKHLLDIDPKNSAAKKEMELMKNYWREELESMKKNLSDKKNKKDELSAKVKELTKAAEKQRKRMVIQEVDSEDEDKSGMTNKTLEKEMKPKVQVIKTDSHKHKQPVHESKDNKPSPAQSGSSKRENKKNSAIKETSQGLPNVPKVAPKLDKATPYEFISAWNALKKSETVEPYYDLLKQIKPSDIKTVISNKLDGAMLRVITQCVAEHYLPKGEGNTGYEILKNLSSVPRFSTVAMFMSANEKSEVKSVLDKLETLPSKSYSAGDIKELRNAYSV